MEKIVHLDLKGAPLNPSYLESVFKSIKSWGATGILLEWEDTFPYSGDLEDIGSGKNCNGDGMYSMEDVRYILRCIKDNGLEPIQLIQTIGHMEFVLKHPAFKDLREVSRTPAVLCPSKPESQTLVKEMLRQTLEVQRDAKYFHIGADEVWHTAVCLQCQSRAALSEHKAPSLFLEHIRDIVLYVKDIRPDLVVLMWDDMLRSISLDTLMHYNIEKLIDPVVWNYNVKEHFQIDSLLWKKYRIFHNVWAGSAFKGANGSCQVLSPVGRYISNQEAWVKEMKENCENVNFVGVILTGWSRYDHYSTLCELLPVSLPSLSNCLRTWVNMTEKLDDIKEVLPNIQWPGMELALCMHSFVMLRERSYKLIHGDLVSTWLNPWQVEHNYTSPVQVEGVTMTSQSLLTDLKGLQEQLQRNLLSITGPRSTDEWMSSYMNPILHKMVELHEIASRQSSLDASVRPT